MQVLNQITIPTNMSQDPAEQIADLKSELTSLKDNYTDLADQLNKTANLLKYQADIISELQVLVKNNTNNIETLNNITKLQGKLSDMSSATVDHVEDEVKKLREYVYKHEHLIDPHNKHHVKWNEQLVAELYNRISSNEESRFVFDQYRKTAIKNIKVISQVTEQDE